MSKVLFLTVALSSLFGAMMASPQVVGGYEFPADAESYLDAPLDTSFSCEGQEYGYYADVNNNCQVFHVCWPILSDLGDVVEYAQWSFICGNATIFDQSTLTCNYPQDSFPCEEAPSLYGAVEFGKIEWFKNWEKNWQLYIYWLKVQEDLVNLVLGAWDLCWCFVPSSVPYYYIHFVGYVYFLKYTRSLLP